jgi:hypothetical protein
MTNSVCINEDIFLQRLQHFQKHLSTRKCLFIPPWKVWINAETMVWKYHVYPLARHTPYNLCTKLCSRLSRHTVTMRQQTLCTTILMLRSPNFILENFPPMLGTQEQQLAMLSEGSSRQIYFLWSLLLFPKASFCPLSTLKKIQPTPCHQTLDKFPVSSPE